MSLWGTQLTLLQKGVMLELRLNESLSSGERSTRGRGVGRAQRWNGPGGRAGAYFWSKSGSHGLSWFLSEWNLSQG